MHLINVSIDTGHIIIIINPKLGLQSGHRHSDDPDPGYNPDRSQYDSQ